MYDLVVTHEFGNHFVGERITDSAVVDDILSGHNASYCVKVPAEEKVVEPAKAAPATFDDDDKGFAPLKK